MILEYALLVILYANLYVNLVLEIIEKIGMVLNLKKDHA
jgi:hypothetical protein